MRTLGLVGGSSWVSTIEYYRFINEGVNKGLGGSNYAQCVIHSFNFADLVAFNATLDWDGLYRVVEPAAQNLIRSGAQAIVLCANTMHVVADQLEPRLKVPLIHIAEATAEEIKRAGLERVALLGTRYTMELDFFKDRLKRRKLSVATPDEKERTFINDSIFKELTRGVCTPESKQGFLEIMGRMAKQGAQGFILGCTEIPLLIKPGDFPAPMFDTTAIHAAAAVRFALE